MDSIALGQLAGAINLETAVGCARVRRDWRARQGATTPWASAHKAEQRSMARQARCNRAHSALTHKVNMIEAGKVNVHAVFLKVASGQLPFLGLRESTCRRRQACRANKKMSTLNCNSEGADLVDFAAQPSHHVGQRNGVEAVLFQERVPLRLLDGICRKGVAQACG